MDDPEELEEVELVEGMKVMIPILIPDRGDVVRERILTVVRIDDRRATVLGDDTTVVQRILIVKGVGGAIFEHDLALPVKVNIGGPGQWATRKAR